MNVMYFQPVETTPCAAEWDLSSSLVQVKVLTNKQFPASGIKAFPLESSHCGEPDSDLCWWAALGLERQSPLSFLSLCFRSSDGENDFVSESQSNWNTFYSLLNACLYFGALCLTGPSFPVMYMYMYTFSQHVLEQVRSLRQLDHLAPWLMFSQTDPGVNKASNIYNRFSAFLFQDDTHAHTYWRSKTQVWTLRGINKAELLTLWEISTGGVISSSCDSKILERERSWDPAKSLTTHPLIQDVSYGNSGCLAGRLHVSACEYENKCRGCIWSSSR